MNGCFRYPQIIYCIITTLLFVWYIYSPVLCMVVDLKKQKQKQKELKFKEQIMALI